MNASQGSSAVDGTIMENPGGGVSFGRYLQSIRMERHLRLEQVAEVTRIGLSNLEAIEAEDFSRLPPEVFLKGFLRAFANAIGADPAEALRRYDTHQRLRASSRLDVEALPAQRGGLWRVLAIVLMLLAALMAASIYADRRWGGRPPEPVPAPPAAEPGPAVAPRAEAPAPEQPSEAAKLIPLPGVVAKQVLTVSAQEACWIKVVVDQKSPSEHALKAGGSLVLEAQSGFNLLIGNAGAVRLSLNGRPVQVPGKRGDVVNIQLP